MIRLYLDWNVLVGLKNGLFEELKQLLSSNTHRFSIFYSTAHIGDLYKSYRESTEITDEIKTDLDFISELTADKCFTQTKEGVRPEKRNPHTLFEDRIASEEINEGLLDTVNGNATSDPLLSLVINSIPDIPLDIDINENNKGHLSLFYPKAQVGESPTMRTMVHSIISLFHDLNHTDKYKALREVFQNGLGLNRDKVYNSPRPFQTIDSHLKNSPLPENSYDEFLKKIESYGKEEPKTWFDQLTVSYISLDMAGYKEDGVVVNDKKAATFKNTIEDSFHVAFGSQTDFYITNDKRNYFKARAVYEKFSINTRVLKPAEFITYINECLQKEQGKNFLQFVLDAMQEGGCHEWVNENGDTVYTCYLNTFILDYFNKIHYSNDAKEGEHNNWQIVLTKEKPTNGRFTMLDDIQMVIAKLIHLFGIPQANKLFLTEEELKSIQDSSSWDGRKWQVGNLNLKAIAINGYFQFYIQPR